MIYWILNIIFFTAMLYPIFRSSQGEISKKILLAALALRVLAGFCAAYIFREIYAYNDSIVFFETAKSLINEYSIWAIISGDAEFIGFETQPRVIFFLKILSVLVLLSGESYLLISLQFAVLSFLFAWHFSARFLRLYPQYKLLVIGCFLFIPSVIFWSVAVMKGALAYGAVLILTILILKIDRWKKLSFAEVFTGIIALWVLLMIKHYLLITVLLFAGLTFGFMLFRRLTGPWRWALAVLLPVIFFISTRFVHPYLKIERIPQTLYENNQLINDRTVGNGRLGIEIESPEWMSVLKETPKSVFSGLFRPNFFDTTPNLGLVHKTENLLLLILVLMTIVLLLKKKPKVDWPKLVPAIFCILMLATMLALSTPNIGTLVRYKSVLIPFLFFLSGILPFHYISSKTKG